MTPNAKAANLPKVVKPVAGGRERAFSHRARRGDWGRRTDAAGNRAPFGTPVNLGVPVNSAIDDWAGDVSLDWPASGSKLYFTRWDGGQSLNIFEATWHPDCNKNGEDDVDDIRDGDSFDCNENGILASSMQSGTAASSLGFPLALWLEVRS